jgi:hypothetical protein
LASAGRISALVAQKAYHRKKTDLKNCRRAWVDEFGIAKAIPKAMWPLMPDGVTYREWQPPDAWLTPEQQSETMCAEYIAQLPLLAE